MKYRNADIRAVFFLLIASCHLGFGQVGALAPGVKQNTSRVAYNIVFDGNSWVAGSGATGGLNYPNQVKALLKKEGKAVELINYGIPGQMIDRMLTNAASKIDTNHTQYQFLIGLELVNQWGNTDESREVIYGKYKKYFLGRKAAGFQKVIALTPIAQGFYKRANWEADRQWFISKMLEEFPKLGIGIANVGGDPKLSDWKNTTYFTADRIHPTNAGYAVFAEIVYNTIIHSE